MIRKVFVVIGGAFLTYLGLFVVEEGHIVGIGIAATIFGLFSLLIGPPASREG